MIMNGSSTQFINAVADGCSHSPNVPCSLVDCGLDCSYHHRNYHNMSNQIYNNGILNNHIYIMWSDRIENTYCHKDSSGNHETVATIACVCDSRPIILFLRISGSDSNQKIACMALNIVHESAHTFGMDDVYNVPGHDVNGAYVCIMERFERSYAYKFYQDIIS